MQTKVLKTLVIGLPLLLTGGCKDYLVGQLSFLPEKAESYPAITLPDVEEIWLKTEDNVDIHGFYLKNDKTDRILLFFHGNAGNAYSRLPNATLLRDMGFNVLLVDYRGYGKSAGTASEQGIYLDAQAAYDTALRDKGFDQSKIYLYGRSIGSTAAVELASRHNVAATVLVAPLSSGRAMAEKMGFGWFDWLVSDVFDNLGKAKHIRSPILILHGEQDSIVPLTQGQSLFDAIPHGKKELVIASDSGHNDISDSNEIDFWLLIKRFYGS